MGLLIATVCGDLFARYVQRQRQKGATERELADASKVVEAMCREEGTASNAAWVSPAGSRSSSGGRQPICRICMCPADCPTAAPCCHIYCWECIVPWVATKPSCPLCRAAALP